MVYYLKKNAVLQILILEKNKELDIKLRDDSLKIIGKVWQLLFLNKLSIYIYRKNERLNIFLLYFKIESWMRSRLNLISSKQ